VTDLWQPGDPVLMRHARDHYRWAAPMRVAQDTGDFVALYLQPGNQVARMGDADGNSTRDFFQAVRVVHGTWGLNHALNLVRAGDRHAVELLWDERTWEFRCWYINFQDPLRRTERGFETMDLTLDLLIAPDLRSWRWKDEDEFEQGIEFGWYTRQQLAELKACGERVLEQAGRRDWPFNEPWPEWRPDPSWRPLQLPPDWDE
jgi:hypothetical protein